MTLFLIELQHAESRWRRRLAGQQPAFQRSDMSSCLLAGTAATRPISTSLKTSALNCMMPPFKLRTGSQPVPFLAAGQPHDAAAPGLARCA